jgi:hypothetical protein
MPRNKTSKFGNDAKDTASLADVVKYDVKKKYGALGDGQRHPIYPTYPSLALLQSKYPLLTDSFLTSMGIDTNTNAWQTLEIDWCAIQQCLLENNVAYIPKGDYSLTVALNCTNNRILKGEGRLTSILTQYTPSEPILEVGNVPYVSDLKLWHYSLPTGVTFPEGAGIRCVGSVNDGSAFERLYIQNVTSGFVNSDTEGFHVYSVSFRDIRVWRYTHAGFYLGGDGNTGCSIDNLYILNLNYDGSPMSANYGFYASGYDEFSCKQMNIEGCSLSNGVQVVNSGNFHIDSLHFEQYHANKDYGAFLVVGGLGTTVRFGSVSIVYSFVDGVQAPHYNFLNVGGSSQVTIDGFRSKANTITNNPQFIRYYSLGDIQSGAYIKTRMFRNFDGILNNGDILATFIPPILREHNDNRYYWEENGKRIFTGTTMPTTGSYNTGDEVRNTNKTEQGTSGSKYVIEKWLRLTTGSSHVLGTDWLALRLFTGN